MRTTLIRSAAAWTGIGLAGGLYYGELTKHNGLGGTRDLAGTQLAVVHTHALTLGTLVLLLLLVLVAQFRGLDADRRFRWGVTLWQAGLALLTTGMLVKGTLQVTDTTGYDSPALAGLSGLGHMILTAAFVLLFLALGRAVRDDFPRPATTPEQVSV